MIYEVLWLSRAQLGINSSPLLNSPFNRGRQSNLCPYQFLVTDRKEGETTEPAKRVQRKGTVKGSREM